MTIDYLHEKMLLDPVGIEPQPPDHGEMHIWLSHRCGSERERMTMIDLQGSYVAERRFKTDLQSATPTLFKQNKDALVNMTALTDFATTADVGTN